jgi:hypothetical protein
VQDLGDAAHAGAADPDEVDVLDGVFHAPTFRAAVTFVGARGPPTKWMCLTACFMRRPFARQSPSSGLVDPRRSGCA